MSDLWPYPGLKDRVFLDYPFDILLNRECSLKSHEDGLVPALWAYSEAVKKLVRKTTAEEQEKLSAEFGELIKEQVKKDRPPKVKDWQAAVKGNDWGNAFEDPSAVKEFEDEATAQLKRVPSCPEAAEAHIRLMLQLHSLLCHRTIGSLLLPDKRAAASGERRPASGNIVIEGTTGAGKSTLALQFALAMTHWPNRYNAVYVSLEESVDNLCAKAKNLSEGWRERLQPVVYLDDIEEGSSPETVGKRLKELLWQPGKCPMRKGKRPAKRCLAHKPPSEPRVLLPGLSPRNIVGQRAEGHGLFWERLQQVERLLVGAKWLAHSSDLPPVGLVCIDSLNTFGDRLLSREELCRLFDLFRQYKVIGLCTVEAGPETEQMASSDLVDILIRLEAEKDAGYSTRYFEIVKSRYQHQIYGRHPYKIRSEEDLKRERPKGVELDRRTLFQALRVYPSIHTVVAATELDSADQGASDAEEKFDFGIEALRRVLSPTLKPNSVLAVVGEHNTYKTPLAQHFLLYGLFDGKMPQPSKHKEEPESALLIRLHEQVSFNPKRPWMLADDLFDARGCLITWEEGSWREEPNYWLDSSKLMQRCYRYQPNGGTDGPFLFELALKSGAILPEEFLQFVRNIFRNQPAKHPIRRVVLDNVALIGASYPFLRHSQTAGDFFLSAFVHVMRNYRVDLLLLGTKTGLVEADAMVNLAGTLADEVLTCEYCDVFGGRYITVRGGGLAAGEDQRAGGEGPGRHYEMVPAVIVPKTDKRFSVDLRKLEGLVGFGTNRIHRPGLTLHTFEESHEIHGRYNRELEELIGAKLGASTQRPAPEDAADHRESPGVEVVGDRRARGGVEVVAFGSKHNQSFHDGLELMAGKPIDKTIVATVDEYFVGRALEPKEGEPVFAMLPRRAKGKRPAYLQSIEKHMEASKIGVVPYYANALVVAYRSDKLQKTTSIPLQTSKRLRLTSWTELLEVLAKVEDWRGPKFACDRSAVETGACLLLDSLVPQKSWDAFAKKPADTLESLLKESGNMAKASEVLTALRDLGLTAETPGEELPLDALVYVCWYSQLRDVILRSAKRKGENAGSSGHIIEDLTRKLGVCALPCGGFTGDWYIGVIYGSVSISLGLDLVEMLCDPKEELKRLGQGVGLPTLEKFYNASFSAWPESKAMLSRLGTIHANARSRAEIIGYPVMKNALYGAWNELCAKVTVGSILRRLPKRMKALEVLSRRAEPPKLS